MKATVMVKGLLGGTLPFARLGTGPRKVVIFPGLADAALDVTWRARWLPAYYQRFTSEFTVYVISRKRKLPRGYSTRDMAADYAGAFKSEIGQAAVVGLSLGGYVAQNFAADYPQFVERLVIACAAHRVCDQGRETPERWLALAKADRWPEFYDDIARVTAAEFRQALYRFLIPLLRYRWIDPTDLLVSLQACLAHDATELLERIQVPTLVIGGTNDIFFPPTLLQQTARRIRNATLRLMDGGHGLYELRKGEFEDEVLSFLRGKESPAPSLSVSPAPVTSTLATT